MSEQRRPRIDVLDIVQQTITGVAKTRAELLMALKLAGITGSPATVARHIRKAIAWFQVHGRAIGTTGRGFERLDTARKAKAAYLLVQQAAWLLLRAEGMMGPKYADGAITKELRKLRARYWREGV
jgi:hypothetical protein